MVGEFPLFKGGLRVQVSVLEKKFAFLIVKGRGKPPGFGVPPVGDMDMQVNHKPW